MNRRTQIENCNYQIVGLIREQLEINKIMRFLGSKKLIVFLSSVTFLIAYLAIPTFTEVPLVKPCLDGLILGAGGSGLILHEKFRRKMIGIQEAAEELEKVRDSLVNNNV